ncbi:hypothetical protein NEIRO02_2610 [Nematocida sp. AWRm79]|nr:hypothetical protein NEIRO02_2610 [Nematocida sp. AWRm79]
MLSLRPLFSPLCALSFLSPPRLFSFFSACPAPFRLFFFFLRPPFFSLPTRLLLGVLLALTPALRASFWTVPFWLFFWTVHSCVSPCVWPVFGLCTLVCLGVFIRVCYTLLSPALSAPSPACSAFFVCSPPTPLSFSSLSLPAFGLALLSRPLSYTLSSFLSFLSSRPLIRLLPAFSFPALFSRLFFFLFLSPAHARVFFVCSFSLLPLPLPLLSSSSLTSSFVSLPLFLLSSLLLFCLFCLFCLFFSLLPSLWPVLIPACPLSAPSLLSSLLRLLSPFLVLSLFSLLLSFSNSSLFFFYFAFWTLFSSVALLFSLFFQDCLYSPCTRSPLLGTCPSARSPPLLRLFSFWHTLWPSLRALSVLSLLSLFCSLRFLAGKSGL